MSYSITPLLTGVRNPDQGIMTYQQGYGKRIWLPIWAFLVQGQGHNILVDTGLDENELIIPAGFTEETGLVPASLVDCLSAAELDLQDIEIIINTHLHDDHCGNNNAFQDVQYFAHKLELEFCASPHPIDHRYDECFIDGLDFNFLEDGQEVVPGVHVSHSPGHTPGCLSVHVETGEGLATITGFCCNNENFPAHGPAVCPGVHLNAMTAWESIQKVKDMGTVIVPMHELSLTKINS